MTDCETEHYTVPSQTEEDPVEEKSARMYKLQVVEDYKSETEGRHAPAQYDTKDSSIAPASKDLKGRCPQPRIRLWIERVIAALLIAMLWTLLAVMVVFFNVPQVG